jgi:hypothetical protein
MIVSDPLEAILGMLFMLTGGFMLLSRLWLVGRMKKPVPGLSRLLAASIFYLESKYCENRKELGEVGLRTRALVVFLSPVLLLGLCVSLYLTRG